MSKCLTLIKKALEVQRGDDLARMRAKFRGMTEADLNQPFGDSGKTCAQVLQQYETHYAEIDAALAWLNDLATPPLSVFKERRDVLAFHQKFNVPMSREPAFLNEAAFNFRVKFMQEELDEFREGHMLGDMHEAADALVDLAYVLHGTALMMGLPWPRLWDEVQRANMAKVRAKHAGESKRGSALDVVKPEGWIAPDHTAALGTGPWDVFNHDGGTDEA
jgi:predicted HAD superfamily Cof-like phosphohydrolase